jgi:hypothetical protein
LALRYRYVKSTVCRHRGVWRRADDKMRQEYEAMGADEKAMWGEFVRTVEKKVYIQDGSHKDGGLEQGATGPHQDGSPRETAQKS